MPARPKLTQDLMERIGQALRAGATYKHAAAYGGISESTFYEWMHTKPEFAEYIHAREGEASLALLALVNVAAKTDWRAASWILEHRWPEAYAVNRIDIHHSGEVKLSMDLLADLRGAVEQLFPNDAVVQERLADALATVKERVQPAIPAARNRAPRTTRKERERPDD